jgi:hypothetical protein
MYADVFPYCCTEDVSCAKRQPQTDLSYFCLWLTKTLEQWNKLNI